MHARAQVDEAIRRSDHGRQHIRGEHVDRKDVAEPVDGLDPSSFSVANAGVVDDGVVPSEGVGLLGDQLGFGDAGEVTDDDVGRVRQSPVRISGTCLVPRMQRDLVTVVDEQSGGHQTQTVARSRNQNPGHLALISFHAVRDHNGLLECLVVSER